MIKKHILKAVFSTFCIVASLAFGQAWQDKDPTLLSEEYDFRIGLTAQAFSKGYREDIRIALETWGEKITQKYNRKTKITIDIFDNLEEMQREMLKGEIDLLVVSSVEYLILERCTFMEPTTAESTGGKVGQEFILLIRRDADFDSLQNLEGSEIIIHNRAVGEIPGMWLDVLLGREGVMDKERFFKKIKIVEEASRAVLPVYFRQTDACIVTARAFDTIGELNPQLKQDLDVILRSPPYLRGLSLINNNMDPDVREDTLDALFTMKEKPAGQQIHLILQIEEIVPFKPKYLDTINALYEEHQVLMKTSSAGLVRKGKHK